MIKKKDMLMLLPSVFHPCLVSWFGNLSLKNKTSLKTNCEVVGQAHWRVSVLSSIPVHRSSQNQLVKPVVTVVQTAISEINEQKKL